MNLTEKVGTVGIPLKRVDGSTGILEARWSAQGGVESDDGNLMDDQ